MIRVIAVEFVYSIKKIRRIHSHAKCTYRVLARRYVVTICHEDIYGRYCIKKILNNDHFHPLFDIIVFLLSRINYSTAISSTGNFFTCVPPKKPCDIVFILSVLKRLQSWRISRLKDNSKGNL